MIEYLTEAQQAFARDADGLYVESYLEVKQKFDAQTFHGFAIETDVHSRTSFAVTSVDMLDATGAAIAAELQSQIDAALTVTSTVTYHADSMRFDLSIPGVSWIELTGPDDPLYPWVLEIFGNMGRQQGSTFYGAHPVDSTVETDFPHRPITVERVEWDGYPLYPMPFTNAQSPEMTGDPSHFSVMDKKMRLFPTPTTRKTLHALYFTFPNSLPSDPDAEVDTIPAEYHMALVFFAAHTAAANNFEYSVSKELYGRYRNLVMDYKVRRSNNNSKMDLDSRAPFGRSAMVTGRVV
jgi:hypothetical protein